MPNAVPVEIPQLYHWLTRLTRAPGMTARFVQDPVLFAHWYALGGTSPLNKWPKEVVQLQESQRARKLSFDRTMALLSKVSVQVRGRVAVDLARSLLEGFEVHGWLAAHQRDFDAMMDESVTRLEVIAPSAADMWALLARSPFASRVKELQEAIELSALESDLLLLALTCAASPEVLALIQRLILQRIGSFSVLWAHTLGCSEQDLHRALSTGGPLRASGLLRVDEEGIPFLERAWLELLTESGTSTLFDLLLEPMANKPGAGLPARLLDEDKQLATQILSKRGEKGVNLLLYGAEGLEKRAMLAELTQAAGLSPFVMRQDERFRGPSYASLVFVAQRLLRHKQKGRAVMVVDRPLDVLERTPSEFFRAILGITVDSSHIRSFDEMILEETPVPTLWLNVSAGDLSEEILARFVFHAKLLRASKTELKSQLQAMLADLRLTKKTTAEITKLADISALQLRAASRAAKLSGAKTRAARERVLLQALRRSLAAMQRQTEAKQKECVTGYSLEFLNSAGRFGPEQIARALSMRPKGSLCLYGLPGTGKTQFVEYLATTLGLPLVSRRASELLDMYVGNSEKKIAAMFAEAEAEEAILFLDEGDSFLRDRGLARHEWEVTRVNELLQHMERFPGIFIVATNLFTGLDQAALRRFTFKLEFLPLNMEQRLRMFLAESGAGADPSVSPAQIEAWHMDLMLMPHLTAGDFATVKRQMLLLNEPLSPAEWIEQLRIECAVKPKDLSTHSQEPST